MKAKAIDVVIYPAKDLEQTVAFYRDILGFPIDEDIQVTGNWVEIEITPVTLALTSAKTFGIPGPIGGTIAIAVDDVYETTEELRQKGVTIIKNPFDAGSCYMARIEDINGNYLWLHQRKDGTWG